MLRHPLVIVPAALGITVAAGITLTTKYEPERTLRIEAKTQVEMETTSMTMMRDGEPVEGRGGGAGALSTDERSIVRLDTVLASDDGAPTKVRRVYETVEGTSSRTFGEQSMDTERESPFSGVELVLEVEDGDVTVEVEDGDAPDDELLEGQILELALDALLPDDEVAEDDEWELDADALHRILGIDMMPKLFPPQQVEEEEGGGGRGRGGRRGGRRRGGGGAAVLSLLASDDWEGTATLSAESEETDEGTGAVIEFKAECSGDLPEREGRGGNREFFVPEFPEYGPATRRENTFEIELEGRLVFSVEDGHPLHLEVEGNVTIETYREFGRNDVSMSMESTQEGTYGYEVTVTSVKEDEE